MRRVTSWLHVWLESGRRVNPCRMVPSKRDEVREARTAAMTSRQRCASCELVRRSRVAALVLRDGRESRAKQASVRVNRIPEAGVEDPLSRAQDTTS